MTTSKMGRWASGGLLLATMLVVAGCTDQKRSDDQGSDTENMSDTRPIAPPTPAPDPIAPPTLPAPVQPEKPAAPPPAEAPSAEVQMQDDADASGMTSPVQADNAEPSPNQNAD